MPWLEFRGFLSRFASMVFLAKLCAHSQSWKWDEVSSGCVFICFKCGTMLAYIRNDECIDVTCSHFKWTVVQLKRNVYSDYCSKIFQDFNALQVYRSLVEYRSCVRYPDCRTESDWDKITFARGTWRKLLRQKSSSKIGGWEFELWFEYFAIMMYHRTSFIST